jgi:tripartite-type tricarboxylate transporter receptor subunit TctC
MNKVIISLTAGVLVLASPQVAAAQDAYPSRSIRLIVPFAAGGNTDVVARLTANYMQNALGVNVVVENRAGAGGLTGTHAVVTASSDGYTLCVCGMSPITMAPIIEKVPYDPLTDLKPISLINTNPMVLIVNPKVDAKDAAELASLSKRLPGGLRYGTVGAMGLATFAAEIFRAKTGSNFTAVPYRGGALATTAVVTGEVELSFANMSDAMAQMATNAVRPLAITTATRSPLMPQLPTLLEQGLVDYPVETWNALFAPAGTPEAIINRLAEVLARMARDGEIERRMATFGSVSSASSPSEFTAMLREETNRWNRALTTIRLINK